MSASLIGHSGKLPGFVLDPVLILVWVTPLFAVYVALHVRAAACMGCEHPTLPSRRFRFRHSRMGIMSCHSRQSVWPGKYRSLAPQSLVAEPDNCLASLQNLEITICDLKLKAKIMTQWLW
jgi:hypothetical protein